MIPADFSLSIEKRPYYSSAVATLR